jgi:hypothetical protein
LEIAKRIIGSERNEDCYLNYKKERDVRENRQIIKAISN